MANDRELLESAAKAAGVYTTGNWNGPTGLFCGLRIREDDCPGGYCWNPLIDDAQALRLAVKLRLVVDAFEGEVIGVNSVEKFDPSGLPATRRAIVRAAAAIGGA